ncbi:hypothetical protein ACQP1G_20445 [Nocardia sp. CA-107356]|uniref:hypothetical protein n=1 Tax=Nocardia sp. CA-107356 TaxID=3239972 RepID=UPI003D942DBE
MTDPQPAPTTEEPEGEIGQFLKSSDPSAVCDYPGLPHLNVERIADELRRNSLCHNSLRLVVCI